MTSTPEQPSPEQPTAEHSTVEQPRGDHFHTGRSHEPDDVDATVETVDPAAVVHAVTDAPHAPGADAAAPLAPAPEAADAEPAADNEPAADAAPTADAEPAREPAPAPAPVPTTPTMEELDLALAALDEIAPKGAVGEVQDALLEAGDGPAQVVAIRHASTLGGYPDWSWTVLLSRGLEGGPTVLEVALLPGETSLLAPAWVPWADRLADYLAAKEAAGAEADETDDEDDELESDLEEDLEDDFDDDFDEDDEDDDDWHDDADDDAEPDDAESDAEPDDAR